MKSLVIAGGVYHERSIWPDWDQLYGSGGRAAAALAGHVDTVDLRTYARTDTAEAFKLSSTMYGFALNPVPAEQTVSFEYVHSLSIPRIVPNLARIRRNTPLQVKADTVLRFGMLEGSAIVEAERCVYDPQSPQNPEPFHRNGSRAKHIAIVGNSAEISSLGNNSNSLEAAQSLLGNGVDVVVVKRGPAGATVVEPSGSKTVPAFQTEAVWTIGSGDVFAAMFAARWAVHGDTASDAAMVASRAVASYVGSMSLPVPAVPTLRAMELAAAETQSGTIYLAGPFFSIAQRWLIDEARRCLLDLGLNVFSPVHNVGPGPAEVVAAADLSALDECDAIFAILDGLDSGTVFEVGYARARSKPVYGLAQTVSEEDLKMIVGSGCKVFGDFVTALHHVAWRT